MESVFAQGDKGIVLQCYRTKEFFSSLEPYVNKKLTKKIQKDVYRESVALSPLSHEIASVHTTPFKSSRARADSMEENQTTRKKRKKVKFDTCACNDEVIDDNYKQKYTPKTWESITKLYGDNDTTEIWMDTKNGPVKIHKKKLPKALLPDDVIVTNGDANDNHYGRKSKHKIRRKYGKQENKQNISDEIELQATRTSQDRDVTYETSLLNSLRNDRRNRKGVAENFNFKLKPKSKRTHLNYIDKDQKINSSINQSIIPTEIKCTKGPCLEAAKREIRNFLCKCDNKNTQPKSETTECTNIACKLSRSSLGFSSVIKLKDKLLCICNKYSQKFVHSKPYTSECNENKCREAAKSHKYNFKCKCDRNKVVNECSEDTCSKYMKKNDNNNNNAHLKSKDDRLSKRKLSQLKNRSTQLEILKTASNQNIRTGNKITEHEGEQTGEPFFEVQVNPKDMCLLNPIEIKEYLKKYGRRGRNELKCICPSRGILRAGELCSSGVCKKAYKNRQTNFNCWCEKKIVECGDSTCDIQTLKNIRRKGKNIKYANNIKRNKPLLEVQLDMDKMCVVNPKEIQEKIINNINADDICSYGICRDAASKRKIPIYCRCIGKKMNLGLTECTEETCKNPTGKKRSKFCIFCTRICSKSENWSSQNRNRHVNRSRRRSVYEIGPNKLCRGKICSKSDYLRNDNIRDNLRNDNIRDNLRNDNIRSEYVKHLPNCHCRECKDNLKPESFLPTGDRLNRKTIKRTTNKNGNNYPNENVSNNEFINMRSQTEVTKKDEKNHVTCTCAHTCECNIKDTKSESQKYKDEYKARKKKLRNKIISQRKFKKDLKRRAKLDRKREKQAAKLRLKEIKLMRKKMEEKPMDTNFCTAFLLGVLKILLRTVVSILSIIMTIMKDPKGSFWYIRDRVTDPAGTFNKVKKWFDDALILKKLQIAETVRGSDTLTILADHFLDTAFYQSFADKGRTKKEQMDFERKSKARKRRIRKREHQAITSCRHTLLTTLRQTPCLWVYHICPNFYPQCLSLLAFMRNFSNILMFLAALLCWTPCIVSMELCRAIMCCFFCTH